MITKADDMLVLFYVKDMRIRDNDNMLSSIQDAMVKAGLIKDDSYFVLPDTRIKYIPCNENKTHICLF